MPTALGTIASGYKVSAVSPIPTTALMAWYDATDASTFTFTTGAQFTQWRDKGPIGYHLTSVDHANNRRAGNINGKVAVVLDHPAADLALTRAGVNILSLLGGGTDCMVFGVAKFNLLNANIELLYCPDGVGTQRLACQFTDITSYLDLGNYTGARLAFASGMNTSPVLFSYWRNGANMGVAKDGTTLASRADASGTVTSETATLRVMHGTNPGSLGELIHYARYNAADYTAVMNYLTAKWFPASPIPLTGLTSWWDADDASTFSYSSGALVSEWRDKVGTCHLAQATTTSQPSRSGTQNGKTTVVFAASPSIQYLQSSAPAMTVVNNFAMFVACKRTAVDDTPGGAATIIPFSNGNPGGSGGYGLALRANSPNIGFIDYGIAWNASATPDPKAAGVVTLQRVAGTWSMFLNGVATNIALTETPNAPAGYVSVPSHNNPLGGEIYEIIVYNVALSTVERQQVEAYLAAKWIPAAPPVIASVNTEIGTSLGTANPIPSPTGIVAGNLLIAFCGKDAPVAALTASTGWTQIATLDTVSTSVQRLSVFGRIADGGANDALALTGDLTDYCASILRITGHGVTNLATDIKVATTSTSGAGTANPDPPSLNAGSSKAWLWLAAAAVDTTGAYAVTVQANYTFAHASLQSATNVSSCALAVSSRGLTAQTEDPAGFVNATIYPWVSATLAIPPA
jgi:hypothetical protein